MGSPCQGSAASWAVVGGGPLATIRVVGEVCSEVVGRGPPQHPAIALERRRGCGGFMRGDGGEKHCGRARSRRGAHLGSPSRRSARTGFGSESKSACGIRRGRGRGGGAHSGVGRKDLAAVFPLVLRNVRPHVLLEFFVADIFVVCRRDREYSLVWIHLANALKNS